jgi:hypothetical protein
MSDDAFRRTDDTLSGVIRDVSTAIAEREEQRLQDDVHRLLDLVSSSMDWGSGFLDDEDVAAWNRVAERFGYPATAVKEPFVDATGRYRGQEWRVRPLVTCESYVDTATDADRGKQAVRLQCSLHRNHRGQHHAVDPVSYWWD